MGFLVLTRRPGEAVIIRDADGNPVGAIKGAGGRGKKKRVAFDVRRGGKIESDGIAPDVDVNRDGWNNGE